MSPLYSDSIPLQLQAEASSCINVVILTKASESCFPLNFHVASKLIYHSDLSTFSHLARFKKVDAICLDLDFFKAEAPQFLLQRVNNPALLTIPLFIKASSNEDIEKLIQYSIDDFYVGSSESPILGFRLHKFLKHAETLTHENNNQKSASVELAFMAYYDPLTGLPNRQLFKERAHEKIKGSNQNQSTFALMFMDLDGFKAINDTNDHKTGDWLLCQVALRLRNCIKKTDTVARLGGDEFGVLLNDVENKIDIESIAHRLSYRLATPYSYKGQHLRIHTSIGISLFPEHGKSYDILIGHADRAMYSAKKKGKGQFCFA
ncbi:MAG: GGDEF domain-containing protein [Alphaproteobacteria bacterium]|nr:GGDEF domain-containing protein [Alphaproteobacteria bacterium]